MSMTENDWKLQFSQFGHLDSVILTSLIEMSRYFENEMQVEKKQIFNVAMDNL